MKIIWSPLAIDRATEIAEYIAQDSPSAATKWVENLLPPPQNLWLGGGKNRALSPSVG